MKHAFAIPGRQHVYIYSVTVTVTVTVTVAWRPSMREGWRYSVTAYLLQGLLIIENKTPNA
jgi:hypothetical protein